MRLKIQTALLEPGKSTPEIVAEGIRWAQDRTADTAPSDEDDEDTRDFDREWNRRAEVMAAALAVRDYEAADRNDVLGWAKAILHSAAVADEREYRGNDQIEYSERAIAAVGFISLYFRDQDAAARDALLDLAAHDHGAVLNAIGQQFRRFLQHDPRLVRSFIRIVMARSIYSRRDYDEDVEKRNTEAQRARIAAAIESERAWLDGMGSEPPWPELPPWLTRPRRGIRLGPWTDDDPDNHEESPPELYTDENALGDLASHLIPLTIGGVPDWLVTLSAYLMKWTSAANGPQGVNDRESDNRPTTWNLHFFDFIGVFSVALPQRQVMTVFLEPICRFKDEAFHDAAASFLRGFDRATLAIDTDNPENPVAVRARIAERMRESRGFKRAAREKGTTVESHFGDLVYAIFYHESQWGRPTRPRLPHQWAGLPSVMPTIGGIAKDTPTSGFIATIFLNLVESFPAPALLPFVADALAAWGLAYGADAHFWSELGIGTRVCGWLEKALEPDEESLAALEPLQGELLKSLDILIRSGVPQAREVEEKISAFVSHRKST